MIFLLSILFDHNFQDNKKMYSEFNADIKDNLFWKCAFTKLLHSSWDFRMRADTHAWPYTPYRRRGNPPWLPCPGGDRSAEPRTSRIRNRAGTEACPYGLTIIFEE
ncbi:MAG: hypothetical protein DRI57_08515 [Deltaproteobacteria bacterium]|nr:MAG: hypothetical protein DRI57_08515 [Deltaproteobacteria bacterium]